ncbi:hypothetical protein [Streptomyces violarus]|uniref:Uncharacterized protein n=1 Tax=Streptomyces violarus TaxID=67380 RepID=A0A7W5F0J4_9ACTN|nr:MULTISPECIES: hypothetical protein [Streptomyces]MBB3075555.1 hypothetical protein [Streptomyces violarus]WRT98151.1 hypothetical protein VJ737_10840 [Streptomyces sp. CGMCC 4.1772]
MPDTTGASRELGADARRRLGTHPGAMVGVGVATIVIVGVAGTPRHRRVELRGSFKISSRLQLDSIFSSAIKRLEGVQAKSKQMDL